MKTFKEIRHTLAGLKDELRQKYKVKEIGIFGSWVSGGHNANSDIDILVEFSEPIGFFAFLDLEEYLSKLLGVKVDLVTKNALKPTIGKHILKEMIPV